MVKHNLFGGNLQDWITYKQETMYISNNREGLSRETLDRQGFPGIDLNWTRKFVTLHHTTMDAVHELDQIGEHLRCRGDRKFDKKHMCVKNCGIESPYVSTFSPIFSGSGVTPDSSTRARGAEGAAIGSARTCSLVLAMHRVPITQRYSGSMVVFKCWRVSPRSLTSCCRSNSDCLIVCFVVVSTKNSRTEVSYFHLLASEKSHGVRGKSWYISNISKPFVVQSFNQASLAARERWGNVSSKR